MNCVLCGEAILPEVRVGYQIVGYEYDRKQGGTNVVHLRRRTDNVAHRECIEKAKSVAPGQASLW